MFDYVSEIIKSFEDISNKEFILNNSQDTNSFKITKFIEANSDIELLAIGIGHDVSRYYKKAIKISDVQELGDVMISQLSNLFEKRKSPKKLN